MPPKKKREKSFSQSSFIPKSEIKLDAPTFAKKHLLSGEIPSFFLPKSEIKLDVPSSNKMLPPPSEMPSYFIPESEIEIDASLGKALPYFDETLSSFIPKIEFKLAAPSSSEMLPPTCEIPQLVQSKYQKMMEFAKQSFSIQIDSYQFIDPKIVTYEGLVDRSRYPLFDDKIFIMKTERFLDVNSILKILNESDDGNIYHFRGPSGVGKSHVLIQNVFKIRKDFHNKFRVLHMIMNEDYTVDSHYWFRNDFIYAFCKDLDDPAFPKPPSEFNYDANITNGENWFNYLSHHKPSNDISLETVKKYFKKNRINLILFWDQDNIFQKEKKKYAKN